MSDSTKKVEGQTLKCTYPDPPGGEESVVSTLALVIRPKPSNSLVENWSNFGYDETVGADVPVGPLESTGMNYRYGPPARRQNVAV
jgi:hypothetical protein